MILYDAARNIHIALGTVGLVTFWTTAALRKGTRLHRRIGGLYMAAIGGVIATAIPLAAHAYATGDAILGDFLTYLVLITFTAVWLALRAVRRRTSQSAYLGGLYRPMAWVNIAGGATILVLGFLHGSALLMGMSSIGLYAGRQMLSFAGRPAEDRHWWLRRHYTGIVGSGVATHIAFLNLGLRHLLPPTYLEVLSYASWFAPLLLAVLALAWLNRRYARGLRRNAPAVGESPLRSS